MSEIQAMPKWLMRRYAKLWKAFREDEFSFDEAAEALGDDARVVSLCLSDFKKYGWIHEPKQHPDDSRKKLYKLIAVEKAMSVMALEAV